MSDLPRQALRELVKRYGPSLCEDVPRCRGLLRDFCGEHRRECNLLVHALEAKVAHDLLKSSVATPKQILLSRLTARMQDEFGVEEWLARWAVESWGLALGTIAQGEQVSPEMPPTTKPLSREDGRQKTSPLTPTPSQPTPPRRPSSGAGGASYGTSGGTVRPPRSRPIPRTAPSPSAGTSSLPTPTAHAPIAHTTGTAPLATSTGELNRSNTGSCIGVATGVFFLFVAAMAAVGNAFEVCVIPLIIGVILIFWGLRRG